jgi:predicted negative regulator of RcsB-dependent stress response
MSRYYKQSIIILIVFLSVAFSCNGKGWDQGYSHYGFYDTPEAAIQALESGKNLSAGEHFILANAYKDKNELKKAAVHFANSAFVKERNLSLKSFPSPVYSFLTSWNSKSDYYEDAALEIAQIFFKYAEYDYTIKFCDLVTEKDISLYRDAIVLKARSFEANKKFDDSIKYLKQILSSFSQKNLAPVIYIRLASSYQKKGDFQNALSSFMESLSITTESWQGTTAAKEAYSLIKSAKVQIPQKALPLAQGLLSAKEYEASLAILQSISQNSYEKDRVIAAVYYALGKNKEAENILAKYGTSSAERAGILSLSSSVLWEKDKKREAIELIKDLIRNPQYNSKNEHKRLCYYLYEHNSAEAPVFLSLYASRYSADKKSDKMLWLAAKPYIERKDFATANGFLLKQIRTFPDGPFSGNARFWMYKSLLAEKKLNEAESTFQEMVAFSTGSPYTMILMNRKINEYDEKDLEILFSEALSAHDLKLSLFSHAMLFFKNADRKSKIRRLKKLSSAKMNVYDDFNTIIAKESYSSSFKNSLLSTEKYFATGHSEGIQRVLNTLSAPLDDQYQKDALEKDKALLLSTMGKKYGNSYQQLKGTEDLLDSYSLQDNIFLMSEESVIRILPKGFIENIQEASQKFDVSIPTLLAVIKSESEFNHKAVSGAGASGLMQLMPPTAKDISNKIRKSPYNMKDPSDSITFGAYYLSWLTKFFKGNFRDVIAGYNAGPGNVIKWKKELDKSDIDIYTEQIPFDETRGYVLYTEKYLIQYALLMRN